MNDSAAAHRFQATLAVPKCGGIGPTTVVRSVLLGQPSSNVNKVL